MDAKQEELEMEEIVQLILEHSNTQRQLIKNHYQDLFKEVYINKTFKI